MGNVHALMRQQSNIICIKVVTEQRVELELVKKMCLLQ